MRCRILNLLSNIKHRMFQFCLKYLDEIFLDFAWNWYQASRCSENIEAKIEFGGFRCYMSYNTSNTTTLMYIHVFCWIWENITRIASFSYFVFFPIPFLHQIRMFAFKFGAFLFFIRNFWKAGEHKYLMWLK